MFLHLLSTYGHNGVADEIASLARNKNPKFGKTWGLFLLRARIGTEPFDRKEMPNYAQW